MVMTMMVMALMVSAIAKAKAMYKARTIILTMMLITEMALMVMVTAMAKENVEDGDVVDEDGDCTGFCDDVNGDEHVAEVFTPISGPENNGNDIDP